MAILAKRRGPGARLALLPLLTFTLLLSQACTRSAPEWPRENVLVVALPNAPLQFDPRVGTDQSSGRVCHLMLNGLVTKDPAGNIVPDLATSWEILDEGHRYRFHLRDGVRFHDGRELSADDVEHTFTTMLDGTVMTAKRGSFPMVERVEAVDRLTVDFHLSEPSGSLLVDLTPSQGILPAGRTVEEQTAEPIGTGPFRVVGRTPDTVTFEPFEGYWGGAPKLDRVVFREVPDPTVRALELLNGSVQLVVSDVPPDTVPMFRADPHFQVVEAPGANFAYLGFNMEDPLLSKPAVRRALAMSIDRELLVESLWRGLGIVSETILPPGLWARHEGLPPIPHDPGAAARLLEEAGFPDPDGEGPEPRLRLTLKTSTNETYLLQAQIIQGMAAEAGIDVRIRSLEFATLYADVKKGAFQMFTLVRTGAIDPNIYVLTLHSESLPPNGQNRGRYKNPEFDRMIEAGNRFADPAQRRPYYLRAQEIFAEDLPYIQLYTKVNYAVMPAAMRDYESYPSGELLAVKDMGWER